MGLKVISWISQKGIEWPRIDYYLINEHLGETHLENWMSKIEVGYL
jgi:hypothetical protein